MKQLVLLIFGCSFFTVIFAQSELAFRGNALQNAGYSVLFSALFKKDLWKPLFCWDKF
jgi:hypothetical protein